MLLEGVERGFASGTIAQQGGHGVCGKVGHQGLGGAGRRAAALSHHHPYPTAAVSIDLDLFSRVSAVPFGGTAVGPGWDPSVPARLGGRVFWLVVRPASA